MNYRFFVLAVLLVLPSLEGLAQETSPSSFAALLEKVKREDPKLDFRALRCAYTETAQYRPDEPAREEQAAILKLLGAKQYASCLALTEQALQKNYVDFNLHFAAHRCHAALKHPQRAKFHQYVFDGLIKSILASGDGKTPASAFWVISTSEEYALLDVVGLRPLAQTLVKENGHVYDRIDARDEAAGTTLRLYFNLDRPYEWRNQRAQASSR